MKYIAPIVIFASPVGWYFCAFAQKDCVYLDRVIIFGVTIGMAVAYALFLIDRVREEKTAGGEK